MRRLVWFTVGFALALAVCAYMIWDHGMSQVMILLGTGSLLAAGGAIRWRWLCRPAAVLFGLFAGICWFMAYQKYYLLPAMALHDETVQTVVTAADYSYDTAYGVAVDGTIELDGNSYSVRAYINEKQAIIPGDRLGGTFRFRYTGIIGQQEATYHQGQGILLLGYQRGEMEKKPSDGSEIRHAPVRLARRISRILEECLPSDAYPFAKALLLGDSSDISYEINTAFKISGIRHVIAVSGLHVAILFGMLSFLLFNKLFLMALIGIPVLFLFAGAAGFTPSVTRACLMVALTILAQCFSREYDSPTALSFACIVMLVWNPLVITSVSFQLSVGCVAGILLFNERIYEWLSKLMNPGKGKTFAGRVKRWFASSISVTLSAMSLTTPFSAYYFGTVSLIGILSNILCLWVISLIFYGIISICVLSLLSIRLAAAIGWVIAWPIRYVLVMAKLLAAFPLAAVYTKSIYIVFWLIFVYLLLFVFLISKRKRPLILACCAAVGLCAALIASWAEPTMDDCRVTVLDVGQGQSILLQSEGRTFLVDCGGDSDTLVADLVADTLLSQGISHLDGIVLTHCDRDHAGAVTNLMTRVDSDVIFLPITSQTDAIMRIEECTAGEVISVDADMQLSYGNVSIRIFAPIFATESNENSLCVLFTTEKCDILITGDRSTFGERMLLHNAQLPQVDLLIAGHHGSKYSTGEELLRAVGPEVVIISVGEENSYGHPAQELLDRLAAYGCRVYRTDQNGTIVFRR